MEINKQKISAGLAKYLSIMEHLHYTDVSIDRDFQKAFNGYYRMRQRSPEYYKAFFLLLEQQKENKEITFNDILCQLHETTGIVTPSFSSKLLATIRPEMPVWDQFVLKNLGLKAPYCSDKNRISKTVLLYESICNWYFTGDAQEKLSWFNMNFPEVSISDTKKIDLVLWQTR